MAMQDKEYGTTVAPKELLDPLPDLAIMTTSHQPGPSLGASKYRVRSHLNAARSISSVSEEGSI